MPTPREGEDESGNALDPGKEFVAVVWPFGGAEPDLVRRASWDYELRTLYRVGSTPGAAQSMLLLREAAVDRDVGCFAMLLEPEGLETLIPLSTALARRRDYGWLNTKDDRARRDIWRSLSRIAHGLSLLHDQQVIHRNVSADGVVFDERQGARSLRLGGFEWSLRLGVPVTESPPVGWYSPPEFMREGKTPVGFRPRDDWFGFGMLAARCLLDVENYASNDPPKRYERVVRKVHDAVIGRDLTDLERELLLRLLDIDPRARKDNVVEIRQWIGEIVAGLELGTRASDTKQALILTFKHDDSSFVTGLVDAVEGEFAPDEADAGKAYESWNDDHVVRLARYIERNFDKSQLYAIPRRNGSPRYILVGDKFDLEIGEYNLPRDRVTGEVRRTWDLAQALRVGQLRGIDLERSAEPRELPSRRIVVHTVQQARRRLLDSGESWTRYLPEVEQEAPMHATLRRFHEFVTCTNQLELLIRHGEIFPYRVVGRRRDNKAGVEHVEIEETPRDRPLPRFCKADRSLAQFLQDELESGSYDSEHIVVLTGNHDGADNLVIDWTDESERWRVVPPVQRPSGRVELERPIAPGESAAVPQIGFLRTAGMFGQVALIRRRKGGVDRLPLHTYLLRSLVAQPDVYMDVGEANLPKDLDPAVVDGVKQAVIEDVLRVRPIYALQGPPGTGKSTLVAWLLREILEDDPVAQILVTAQAHAAVDVLRDKVRREAFADVSDDQQPLAVRLWGERDRRAADDAGSVDNVAKAILRRAIDELSDAEDPLTPLESKWLLAARDLWAALNTKSAAARNFAKLVERSANLTYCTTSAGNLEALREDRSFDWSIVEESGKAHAFDLALPLQAGHRWLLIGDQKQLPPYRFEDYKRAIRAELDDAVEALLRLPEADHVLLDRAWALNWRHRDHEDREIFKTYSAEWLNTFENIYRACETAAQGARKVTGETSLTPCGAAAGFISHQHRMHPDIGTLISETFYDGKISNETADENGVPLQKVRHPFVAPTGINEKSIVWLDTRAAFSGGWGDSGELGLDTPPYTNPHEIDALAGFLPELQVRDDVPSGFQLAVLSPYNQQVNLINRRLRHLPSEMPALELVQLRDSVGGRETPRRVAHTVDSFQGNQAHVIAVSLVRNNTHSSPERALGFLDTRERINVMFSRAEMLLVLVGSWEFFRHQVRYIDLDRKHEPLWFWKKLLTTLDEWFDSGRALKVDGEAYAQRAKR